MHALYQTNNFSVQTPKNVILYNSYLKLLPINIK